MNANSTLTAAQREAAEGAVAAQDAYERGVRESRELSVARAVSFRAAVQAGLTTRALAAILRARGDRTLSHQRVSQVMALDGTGDES
jgi:hypothetical protein